MVALLPASEHRKVVLVAGEESLAGSAEAVLRELLRSDVSIRRWPKNGFDLDEFSRLRLHEALLVWIPYVENRSLALLRIGGTKSWCLRTPWSVASILAVLAPGWRVYGGMRNLFTAIPVDSRAICEALAQLMHDLQHIRNAAEERRSVYEVVLHNIDDDLFVPFGLCNDPRFCARWRNSPVLRHECSVLLAGAGEEEPERLWDPLCSIYRKHLTNSKTLDGMRSRISTLLEPWCKVSNS